MKIPITKAIIDEADKQAVLKPLESGWLVQGMYVSQFENIFAEFVNSNDATAVANCTAALHLSLEAMNIGVGDKVIVPAFTYVASANAVEYTGAEVIFCDIDLATFNIDIEHLVRLLETHKNVKAVMPVHLFGLCADMKRLLEIANTYKIKVIEDAACAFDAWIDERHAGTFGDCGCFSFHPRKAITTGEGGMIVTENPDIAKKVKQLRDHGASKSDLLRHLEKGGSLLPEFHLRGYNYRMTDIQGALGVTQMKKAKNIMQGRRQIAKQYDAALKKNTQLLSPLVPKNYKHAYQSYVCLFTAGEDLAQLSIEKIDKINLLRNNFMQRLEERGIATRQGTHAVHTLNYYKNRYALSDNLMINAYAADRLSVTLPLYAGMTLEEFEYVIQNINDSLMEFSQ